MLKFVLADVEAERDRLRSARASFSTRLGPLPASVAVVTGIAAAAAGKVDLLFAILAGVVFAGVLAVSIFFGGLKPYREIRAVYQDDVDPNFEREAASLPFCKDDADLADWLNKKIELERRIYGPLIDRKWRWVPLPKVESLRDGIVTERAAANIVQALFLVIAAILIIGIAVHTNPRPKRRPPRSQAAASIARGAAAPGRAPRQQGTASLACGLWTLEAAAVASATRAIA